jgi:hypothetical protein
MRGLPAFGPVDAEAISRTIYGDPIVLDGMEQILVPFAVSIDRRKLGRRPTDKDPTAYYANKGSRTGKSAGGKYYGIFFDSYAPASSGDGFWPQPRDGRIWVNSVHWNNLIFVHKQTLERKRLLDRRASITGFAYLPKLPQAKQENLLPLLLIVLAETDSDGDGFIDGKDAAALYLVDKEGREMTQITSALAKTTGSIYFDAAAGLLYVEEMRDLNRNGKFHDREDRGRLLRIDLAKPAIGDLILDERIKTDVVNVITGR